MASTAAFAEVAAMAGDPARAAMLHALMQGRALTASELARVAGITPQTASGHLARMLKQAGQTAPDVKPVLEVNAEHALVKKLDGSVHFNDLAHILFDQALLAEGGMPDDPAAYVKRVNALLV